MTRTHKHLVPLLVILAAFSGGVLAEACTYREAMMALQQGNVVRGMALLRMASRDGDQRATHQLAVLAAPREGGQTRNLTARVVAVNGR